VDDHAVVRSGLGAFIATVPDLELVGKAENGEQAVVRAKSLQPNVILMDWLMSGMDGVTATRVIKEQNPTAPAWTGFGAARKRVKPRNEIINRGALDEMRRGSQQPVSLNSGT
jgi:chemotaxis response regulator CheB